MSAADYGRTLTGLTLNLIVRDVSLSLPFYTWVLGLRALYSDPDFAALAGHGVRLLLDADHTYEAQRWPPRLAEKGERGLGAETRILGIDPDAAERRTRAAGYGVPMA